MKHIFSVQRRDGTFPDIGSTSEHFLRQGITHRYAVRLAHRIAADRRCAVRVESFHSEGFYRPDSKPYRTIIVQP